MKQFFKSYRATFILLEAILLGAVGGLLFGERAVAVKPLGDIFLNVMLAIIVPLIFVTIATSIAKMQQPKRLGRIMAAIVGVIAVTSLVAVVVGTFATLPIELVRPEDGQQIMAALTTEPVAEGAESISILARTVQAITVDDFSKLLSRNNLIALIVFSVVFGIAANMSGKKAEPVIKFLDGCNSIVLNIIKIVMYYAPIGLGCYFASLVGTFGAEIAIGYAKTFVVYTVMALAYFFVVYSIYAIAAGGRQGFRAFWRHVLPAAVTALATCSSAAAIPVNIESAKKMGVSEDVAETLIPLGTNLHKDGSIIGSVFKILFLASLFGTDLSGVSGVVQILTVALVATLLVTAVPIGGGTIAEMMVLTMMGYPAAALPILTIIATIIDPAATMLNVVGNTSSAMLAARVVDGKNWMKQNAVAEK